MGNSLLWTVVIYKQSEFYLRLFQSDIAVIIFFQTTTSTSDCATLCFKDILATKMEGEPKVKNVLQLAERVLPSTVPQGKEIVVRETDALRSDWEAFVTALTKVGQDCPLNH